MMQFFYKTRNISGLVLIISPSLAVLTAGLPQSFFLPFFCAVAAAVYPLTAALNRLPFRTFTLLCSFAVCTGSVLILQNPSAATLPAALLLGTGSCGLLLLLPSWTAVGWFRRSKTLVLGLVWSLSLFLLPLFHFLFSAVPEAGVLLLSIFLAVGAGWFLQRPPLRPFPDNLQMQERRPMRKAGFYVLTITAASGIGFSMLLMDSPEISGHMLQEAIPVASRLFLAASPLIISLFVEKKGIFSSCVLLIFLCEGTMLCLGLFDSTAAFLAGQSMLCLAAGGIPVVLPVLTFYLYGHSGYMERFRYLVLFLPAGLLVSLPFCRFALQGTLTLEEPVIFLLFLLVLSFFCIFFAWKQRFIILKNEII